MAQSVENLFTKSAVQLLRGHSPRERLLHRLHTVALVLSGVSPSKAGRIYGDSPRAVAYWITRFKREGVAGLEEEARPGRPSKLTAEQMKKLQTFMNRQKKKSKPVNADTLCSYILTEFEISLTPRQCWRILNRLKA